MFTFYTGDLLFAVGVVLNVHKWISFLLKVYTSIKAEKVIAEQIMREPQMEGTFDYGTLTSKKSSIDMFPYFKAEEMS